MTPEPISTAPSGQRILLYCQRKATDEGWWEIGTTNSFGEWINDEFDPSLLLTQPTFWLPMPATPTQPQAIDPLSDVRAKAETGDAQAQYSLGRAYRFGYGVAKDMVEAVKWYRKAAEQGHTTAQTNLGSAYSCGVWVQKDLTESAKWFRKAAELIWGQPFDGETEKIRQVNEESSATLSESFRDGTTYTACRLFRHDGTTYTRSYQVFLPTPTQPQ
jgi:hypothetical protein